MAYRGSVTRLPVGMLGFSGSRNPTQLQPGHFRDVTGVSIDGGLIQKEGGASKLNASALGAPSIITAGISYSPLADVLREAVFLSNGSILKDSGAGTFPTTLASGLTSVREPPPYFMMAGGEAQGNPRTLFCFSSANQVKAVDADGAAMASITTPPADWAGAGNFPTFGVLHEGRLWGGGNASDPHRMYYSRASDHQDFSAPGGTIGIFPGSGERIVGAMSFKGLLVIWKYPRGIYTIITQDPSPSGWRVEQLSKSVGGVNQHTILSVDNDTMYLDAGGNIHLLSATNAFGSMETSSISQQSDMGQYIRDNVSILNIKRAVAVWYGAKQQAQFGFPRIGGSDNNIRLMVDMNTPSIPIRFLKSERDFPISMWIRPDTLGVYRPVHGDLVGFVWLMDQPSRNKDGAAYPMTFETSNMDLSFVDPKLAAMNKTGDFLELIFEPQGDWDLTVTVLWDDIPGPPMLYSMSGGAGASLGVFTLDTDRLAGSAIRSLRKRIAGSGRRVKIIATNTGIDQNIAISDFYLSFRPTDERNRA